MKKEKICIIGAGLTGLTAGYKLSEKYDVTVLEKESQIGGLAGGFEIEGANIEKVYHHIFKRDEDAIKLANEIGLSDKLKWFKSSVAMYYDNKVYPYSSLKDFMLFKPLPLLSRIRLGISLFILKLDKKWQKYTQTTAEKWLIKYAGKKAYNIVWKPLLIGKFHTFSSKISMGWLWARLHIRLNTRDKQGELLGYFEGGFMQISNNLRDLITRNGGKVETNQMVESITEIKDNKIVVKTKNSTEIYDKVLSTIPSNIFAKLISKNSKIDSKYLVKLNSIDYLGAICLVLSTEQDLSQYYWHNINDLDLPFLALLQHTNLVPKKYYNGKHIYYLGSYLDADSEEYKEGDDKIIRKWLNGLKKVLPDFDIEKVESTKIFKFQNAQHIVDINYSDKIPEYKTPIKNLYLSNFSQIYPEDRGVNYAIKAGNKISNILLKK